MERNPMNANLWKIALAALLAAVVGCDNKDAKTTPPQKGDQAAAMPKDLFVAQAPPDAAGVGKIVADAKDGDQVIVLGRVAGRTEPFVPGRAAMVIADMSLPACNERPGDTCPAPWDLCCEPQDVLAAKTVLVEVADKEGMTIKAGLKGVGGLKPLSQVIVAGTLKRSPDGKGVSVKAKSIYVKPAA